MHRELHVNRQPSERVTCSDKHMQLHQKTETNGFGVPIPNKKHVRRQSTNESDDSNDSFCYGENSEHANNSPVTAFSRSLSSSGAGNTLNVYSMSPRSTSVMYQYYSTPRGYFQNQTSSNHSGRPSSYYRADEHTSNKMRYRNLGRTLSECCESTAPSNPAYTGIPQTATNDVVQDPRRRAYSESDSSRRNSMNMSRMSAMKKLRKKLARNGSLKKRKDESHGNSTSHNHSVVSINSLEKVEEGRQLRVPNVLTTSSSKRNSVFDELADFSSLSLHEENETSKPSSQSSSERIRPPSRDRSRNPSNESVFNHDGDLIYQRFLEEHTCYDIMPTSCKLVVFDTRLQARKAFHALISNSVRAAPLWDSEISCYVGMLTVTDFIRVVLKTHKMKDQRVESVEEQNIQSWRKLLNQQSSFANVRPNDTLLHSLNILFNEHFHGVPIMDERSGDILHIIDHKRILRFLHLFMNELPKPAFMNRPLGDLKIGRFDDIPTVTKCDTISDVLELLIGKQLCAIPVVDDNGDVIDIFCKLDMISLAAQGLYHDLSMTMEIALSYRFTAFFEEDDSTTDSLDRLSPKPEKHETVLKGGHSSDLSGHLNEYNRRSEISRSQGQSSSIRGHAVIRPKSEKVRPPADTAHMILDHPPPEADMERSNENQRVRHISLSNPLVKCKLTDSLQHVIDLMVTTDANLLVVIGQSSNHMIGVVTVADVLNFIVTPPGHGGIPVTTPTRVHRRSRHRFPSSTTTSLPSVLDEPENNSVDDDTTVSSWHSNGATKGTHRVPKHSTSSDTSANDSGYSSASKLIRDPGSIHDDGKENGGDQFNSTFRILRRGVEMERA